MSAISNLSHLAFKASDFTQWKKFAENILGLQVGKNIAIDADH
ncbi:hypothetical protein [Janthinobacterium tructae]|nr:hypothetical protein [Janthinobacterium tructae]MDI3292327.1 hypothetical protein [Janthinobacterium tructae]